MARAHEGWIAGLLGGICEADRRRLYDLLGALKTSVAAQVR